MVLLWAGGDNVQVALRYDRVRILQGEYWRLLTAHWVHADLPHMSLNALGALVLSFLLARTYSIRQWLLILAMSIVAIDVGFLCLTPHLGWYVGASGVLQGALAAGALMWWRTESRTMALALSAIVLGKLIWEQWHGALPLAGEMTVIVDAHLYGAIGGALAAAGIEIGKRISRSKQRPAPL
jgi:rhomboid family GlyGly-CTERM serine protease